jgi:hypothetical protein
LFLLALALGAIPSPCHAQVFLGNGPFNGFGFTGNPRVGMSMAPTLSLYNGQTSLLQIQSFQFVPTNVQVVQAGGQIAFVPQYQPIPVGLNYPMRGVMGPAGLYNRLDAAPTISGIGMGPPHPVVTFITPTFEGGAQGAAVPYIQYLPQPNLSTAGLQTSVGVPLGGYGYLGNVRSGFLSRDQFGVPVLGRMPGFPLGNVQMGGGFNFGGFPAPRVNVFPFP